MVAVKVKWGKETYTVEVDTSAPASAFKEQLAALTNVPADRQKIMGVKGGQLKDDANMADVGLSESKPLMLIGSADSAPVKPPVAPVFAEDATHAGHGEDEVMSNGLVNLGNTCYMNSVTQLLRVVPEVRERWSHRSSSLAKTVASTFNALDSTRQAVAPAALWTALMATNPQFAQPGERGFPMQHDAQEALSTIIEAADEVRDGGLFHGETAGPDGSVEPFSMLRCIINQDVQILEAGIERGLGEGDSARKISALPEYLLIHMARFAWRQDTKENAKVLRPVGFPQVLDVRPYCTEALQAQLEPVRQTIKQRRESAAADEPSQTQDPVSGFYELAAVVSHKGRTLDGGHYIGWARKGADWLVFDDDKVARVTTDDIDRLRGVGEAHIAYVLLYRCRDPATGKARTP